jgi:fructokinase
MFTTIGELLMDFMPVVDEGRTVGFRTYPGGSPYNVAIALARLGAQVEFVGKASTDFFGRSLVKHLQQEGVGIRFLSRSPAPSTLAFVTLERGEPSFAFYGEGSADTLLEPDDLPAGITSTTVLEFGSISLLRGPTAATITHLVGRLRDRTLLCFDPNIRPSLVKDAAAYRQMLTQMFRAVAIVKMSETDTKWLAPDQSPESVAAEVQRLGPALVVVTRGPRGAVALTASDTIQVSAPTVRVVDTVGAGDAFTAGMLLALTEQHGTSRESIEHLRTSELDAALTFAAGAAALTCTKPGANPPRRKELERFLSGSKTAT